MKYVQAKAYLSKLSRFGRRLRLGTTLELLDFLGNPHKAYCAIHVAGTNGKGSVCAIVSSILIRSGYSTGMYISPPLTDFTERIRVNGKLIEEVDVARLTGILMPKVDEMIKKKTPPTFFEVVTAMAFQYFKDGGIDMAIMEVGLGGRLDATNVIDPAVSVITNIQKDHTEVLGDDIADIAREKAGIVKDSIPLVTAETDGVCLDVLQGICKEKKSKLIVVGKDITYNVKKSDTQGQIFDYHGTKNYENLEINLIGSFQLKNASTALAAIGLLDPQVSEKAIRDGLKNVDWPGRMELMDAGTQILLDCAHNPSGARELSQAISALFGKKAVFIIGTSLNKDICGILNELSPVASEFIMTKSKHFNAQNTEEIEDEVKKITDKYTTTENVYEALSCALSTSNDSELICVTGSIFVVGEARKILKNDSIS